MTFPAFNIKAEGCAARGWLPAKSDGKRIIDGESVASFCCIVIFIRLTASGP
jgi:hypothetical protein